MIFGKSGSPVKVRPEGASLWEAVLGVGRWVLGPSDGEVSFFVDDVLVFAGFAFFSATTFCLAAVFGAALVVVAFLAGVLAFAGVVVFAAALAGVSFLTVALAVAFFSAAVVFGLAAGFAGVAFLAVVVAFGFAAVAFFGAAALAGLAAALAGAVFLAAGAFFTFSSSFLASAVLGLTARALAGSLGVEAAFFGVVFFGFSMCGRVKTAKVRLCGEESGTCTKTYAVNETRRCPEATPG